MRSSKKSIRLPLILFISFFMVLVTINFLYFYAAERSHSGMVDNEVGKYSSAFLYAEDLKNQADLAVTSKIGEIKFENFGNESLIYFTFKTEDGTPVSGSNVSLKAMRPVTDKHDFSLNLQEKETGIYLAKVPSELKGQWDLKITAEKEGETFHMHQRLILHHEGGN